ASRRALPPDHITLCRHCSRGSAGTTDIDPEDQPSHEVLRSNYLRLKIAEVAELDAEACRRRARRGGAEADHLGLALPPVAAVGGRVVEPPGMRQDLRDARRELSEVRQRSRERPVRSGPRFAEEVIRRSQPRRARPGAGLGVLAPYGHAET